MCKLRTPFFALIVAGVLLAACTQHSPPSETSSPEQNRAFLGSNEDPAFSELPKLASSFFKVYAQRTDFDRFIMFYAKNAVLQDLVYGEQVLGREAIRGFYRWDAGNVELLELHALKVTEQVVHDSIVVTRGVFKPFKYHGQKMGPWRFIIWQEYNAKGKIIKQFDWINYTPKETFIGGENLNDLPVTHDN